MQVNKQMPITTFEYAAGIPLEKTRPLLGTQADCIFVSAIIKILGWYFSLKIVVIILL